LSETLSAQPTAPEKRAEKLAALSHWRRSMGKFLLAKEGKVMKVNEEDIL
jgi:hypothetical protein